MVFLFFFFQDDEDPGMLHVVHLGMVWKKKRFYSQKATTYYYILLMYPNRCMFLFAKKDAYLKYYLCKTECAQLKNIQLIKYIFVERLTKHGQFFCYKYIKTCHSATWIK